MFSVGDKVVCIDNKNINQIYNLYEEYYVKEILNINIDNDCYFILLNKGVYISPEHFMSLKEFNILKRKDKINKLKERICTYH